MQSARWTSLLLIGLTAAAVLRSESMAQSPAIYAPTIDIPRPIVERPDETPPPKVTEKVIVNPGEVSGRAQVVSGDTLRIKQMTYRLWGVAAPPPACGFKTSPPFVPLPLRFPLARGARPAEAHLQSGTTTCSSPGFGRSIGSCHLCLNWNRSKPGRRSAFRGSRKTVMKRPLVSRR